MLAWLLDNAIGVGALVTALALVWSIVQFMLVRRRDQRSREFEAYHRIIKELVAPDDTQSTWIDRQTAAVFELRNFPRYVGVTARILTRPRDCWASDAPERRVLLDEISLTLAFVRSPLRGLRRVRAGQTLLSSTTPSAVKKA